MGRPFHPPIEALPSVLPIFPLPGVLLLPDGKLPLNIYEPLVRRGPDMKVQPALAVSWEQPSPTVWPSW